MIAFPDTTFLCALYVQQDNSPAAAKYFQAMPEVLHVGSLLLYEFRQSVRFQVWLHSRDQAKGYPQNIAEAALANLQANVDAGAVVITTADWPDVHQRADALSKKHTIANGHRSMDILHVATALHFSAKEFLTFNANQRKLALAGKLRVKP